MTASYSKISKCPPRDQSLSFGDRLNADTGLLDNFIQPPAQNRGVDNDCSLHVGCDWDIQADGLPPTTASKLPTTWTVSINGFYGLRSVSVAAMSTAGSSSPQSRLSVRVVVSICGNSGMSSTTAAPNSGNLRAVTITRVSKEPAALL